VISFCLIVAIIIIMHRYPPTIELRASTPALQVIIYCTHDIIMWLTGIKIQRVYVCVCVCIYLLCAYNNRITIIIIVLRAQYYYIYASRDGRATTDVMLRATGTNDTVLETKRFVRGRSEECEDYIVNPNRSSIDATKERLGFAAQRRTPRA